MKAAMAAVTRLHIEGQSWGFARQHRALREKITERIPMPAPPATTGPILLMSLAKDPTSL
jgi:hypothetical protein